MQVVPNHQQCILRLVPSVVTKSMVTNAGPNPKHNSSYQNHTQRLQMTPSEGLMEFFVPARKLVSQNHDRNAEAGDQLGSITHKQLLEGNSKAIQYAKYGRMVSCLMETLAVNETCSSLAPICFFLALLLPDRSFIRNIHPCSW